MQTLVYQGGLLQARVLEMPGTHIQDSDFEEYRTH